MESGVVIDAHTHPVGHRMDRGHYEDYKDYLKQISEPGAQSEPGRLDKVIEQMDQYHVDQAIGMVAIGLRSAPDLNERMIQVVREHGDRFPAVMIGFNLPPDRSHFNGEEAAQEIEPLLDLPEVKGVGEWAPAAAAASMMSWPELLGKYRPIFEVIAAHRSAVLFHTGLAPYVVSLPRPATGNMGSWLSNPLLIDDIAAEYPEIPLIIGHMGVQGSFFYGTYADMALLTAARNPNVYLETSSAPFEVVEKAVCDPAIGPEKVIFGSDTPTPYTHYKYRDNFYASYGKAPPSNYTDHYKYELENVDRLSIPDEQKEWILGGNIKRILGL